jgi:hypothetical protein
VHEANKPRVINLKNIYDGWSPTRQEKPPLEPREFVEPGE